MTVPLSVLPRGHWCRAELGSLFVAWLSCGARRGHGMGAGRAGHSAHSLPGPPISCVLGAQGWLSPRVLVRGGRCQGFWPLGVWDWEMPHLGPAGPGCTCWAQSCHKEPGESTWEASGDPARRVLGSVAPVAWGPRLATSASPWRPQTLCSPRAWPEHMWTASGPSLCHFLFPSCSQAGALGVARVGLQKAPAPLPAVSVDELNLPVSEARLQEGGSRALSLAQLPGPAWLSQSRSVSPGGWGLGSPQRLRDGACAGRLP